MPSRSLVKFALASTVLFALAYPHATCADAGRAWSETFGLPGVDGNAFCATRWRGGIVVGGQFGLAGDLSVRNVAWFHNGRWEALGGGVDGPVYALVSVRDTLVVCGGFTHAGGIAATQVARWTGSRWAPMGDGLQGDNARSLGPTGFANYRDTLVVFGTFDHSGRTALRNIARWDGVSWGPLGPGLNRYTFAAAVYHDRLFVAGGFDSAGTDTALGLAAWDGASWSAVPWDRAAAGYVRMLAVAQDRLFAGGVFDHVDTLQVPGLAAWDGKNWFALAGGPAHEPLALAVRDDSLYVSSYGETLEVWDGAAWHAGGPALHFARVQSLFADSIGVVAVGLIGLPDPTSGAALLKRVVAREDGDWHALESWGPDMHGFDGDGTSVTALAKFGGEIVAAGAYRAAANGGTWNVLHGLARWDGTRWQGFPGWPRTSVTSPTALLAWGDTLFVFGEFYSDAASWPGRPGYRFDGTRWTPLDTLQVVPLAAVVYRGAVYVAAAPLGSSSVAEPGVWRLDGTHWTQVADVAGTSYPSALALIVFDNRLVVGGQFTHVGAVAANDVAAWDGTQWAPLGQDALGSPNQVVITSFAIVDGALHAGGTMQGESVCVARWDGTDWVPVGPLHGYVGALATLSGRLYAAGSFSSGGRSLSELAAWNGADWQTVDGGMNRAVTALLADGPRLWAGGAFSTAGDVPSYGIALWDSVSASSGEAPVLLSAGVPNPFTSSVEFSYELTAAGPVSITVNDAAGRRVATIESDVRPPGVHTVRWNGRADGGRRLPVGMYFVRIVRPDGRSATHKAVLMH